MRNEHRGSGPGRGVHATERRESLRSRSADPGQSSYGGFANEDPRYQRQQLDPYTGAEGEGYGVPVQGDSRHGGGYAPAWRPARPGGRRILPKGYARSDERLREDVCERLSHSGLDVSDVSVEVAKSQVTLQGTVAARWIKHAIEDCVDDCLGVQDIDNRIRVQAGAAGRGDISVGN